MDIALIGLGRMGSNMVKRLLRGGHRVVAYDRDPAPAKELEKDGAVAASSLEDLVAKLPSPRVVWSMIPAGNPTESTIQKLATLLGKGDLVIDGSNSNWKDSQRLAKQLTEQGLLWLDSGTSGGVWGLENGYCLMVGGTPEAYAIAEPALKTLAPPNGCALVGPAGAGHYTKMIHNGIEYGMLQAYAEGFELLETSPFKPDLHAVSQLWLQGSVVRSWILELAERALREDAHLTHIKGYVDDSGMGKWTAMAAIEQNVPAPTLTLALHWRFRSRQTDSFSAKLIAALRNQFGGHAVKTQ
ncbi:MAG: decarboxylating 6-phosphogluconate dehydrogenase [Deltaproteobacteria bacterium]